MIAIKENEFNNLVKYVKDNYGINLSQKKTLIEGRLSNTLLEMGFKDFSEYLEYIFKDKTGKEIISLISKITTNHTFFLREAQHFDFLANNILPILEKNLRDKDIRIWSAGCSSGEEPYTIAMVLQDYFKEEKKHWDTKVLATDISQKVLNLALNGVYPNEEVSSLPSLWKLNYFKQNEDGTYSIVDSIKKEVIFRVFNLMENIFPFKRKFHVIFCRNVMIYFEPETKAKLFKKFYEALEPGGYLFIGHSESMGKDTHGFKYVKPAIYRKE